mgnify:CR=1 FL=1
MSEPTVIDLDTFAKEKKPEDISASASDTNRTSEAVFAKPEETITPTPAKAPKPILTKKLNQTNPPKPAVKNELKSPPFTIPLNQLLLVFIAAATLTMAISNEPLPHFLSRFHL